MEKLLNAMPLLTSLMLGLLFATGLTWQGLQIRDQVAVNTEETGQKTQAQNAERTPAQTLDLEELKFFGQPGDDASPEVTETEDLPETNMQLVLRGVMSGDLERRDSALVEGPDGETDVYHVNESLPGDAVLRKVHRKRIVIERGGALETLSFPENEVGDSMTVANSSSRPTPDPEPVNEPSSSSSDRSQSSDSGDQRNRSQDEVRERLNQLRERLSDD